ncbi:MAG: diguanylate cyclase [Agarilytica sp.]
MTTANNEIVKHLMKYRKETKGSIMFVWLMLMIPTLIDDMGSLFVWINAAVFFVYDSIAYIYKNLTDSFYEERPQRVRNLYVGLAVLFAFHWGAVTAYMFSNSAYESIYISLALVLAFSTVGGFSIWLLSPVAGKVYLAALFFPSTLVMMFSGDVSSVITSVFMLFCSIILIQQGGFRQRYIQEAISDKVELGERADLYEEISHRDPLTGIGNRRQFDLSLAGLVSKSHLEKTPLSLFVVDIDHFKRINDKYGHEAGDECLKFAAELLAHEIRDSRDVVCRYGGEEFVIIMTETAEA